MEKFRRSALDNWEECAIMSGMTDRCFVTNKKIDENDLAVFCCEFDAFISKEGFGEIVRRVETDSEDIEARIIHDELKDVSWF